MFLSRQVADRCRDGATQNNKGSPLHEKHYHTITPFWTCPDRFDHIVYVGPFVHKGSTFAASGRRGCRRGGGRATPSIWLLDRALEWHYLAPCFTQYFRMLLKHHGLPEWYFRFTSLGLSPWAEQWYVLVAPHLLKRAGAGAGGDAGSGGGGGGGGRGGGGGLTGGGRKGRKKAERSPAPRVRLDADIFQDNA
ncbi:hypothetical protein R5R35_009011 [Gryllus longicercus]|uniref:Tubulin polyglutamylase complex subunit 2 n=1 Tax=Gryllus longicercus TaxID=2509291 RepID=A0AAN9VGR6_9ORTH